MASKADELYEQIQALTPEEQRRLAERVTLGLEGRTASSATGQRHDWRSVRGIAPGLLDGEDAQEWVTRTRHEADKRRNALPEP